MPRINHTRQFAHDMPCKIVHDDVSADPQARYVV
ncbi:hypothetical protein M218_12180 [Burkholderia pseudomallei MSHR338]|nr:hypothetical protein M218_12180 [Burkholderia pseudomallei MSHR338]